MGRRFRGNQQVYTNVIPRDYAFALFMTPGPEGKVWLRGEHDFGAYADGLYKFEGDAAGRTIYLSFTAVNDYGTIMGAAPLAAVPRREKYRECSRIGVRV